MLTMQANMPTVTDVLCERESERSMCMRILTYQTARKRPPVPGIPYDFPSGDCGRSSGCGPRG
jgi:hypothetical protein